MVVGNEDITDEEAYALWCMLKHAAKERAGEFHNENRSEKFRANWPNEYVYAESEWRNFVEAVLMMYAEALGDPFRSEYDKRQMYLATALYHQVAALVKEHYTGEQLMPGTEKFEGTKRENVRITGMFGKHSMNFVELALPGKRFH